MNMVDKFLTFCCSVRGKKNEKNVHRSSESCIDPTRIDLNTREKIYSRRNFLPKNHSIHGSGQAASFLSNFEEKVDEISKLRKINNKDQGNHKRNSTIFIEDYNFSEELPIVVCQPNENEALSTYISLYTNSEIRCFACYKKAKGFCPACPGKRYCKNCYSRTHSPNKNHHNFFAYFEP